MNDRAVLLATVHLSSANMRDVLITVGYDVHMATSGEEAIDLAKRIEPGGVVIDLAVPGKLKGYQVIRYIHLDAATAESRIIALSESGHKADEMWATRQGAAMCLTMPDSPESIVSAVRGGNGSVPDQSQTTQATRVKSIHHEPTVDLSLHLDEIEHHLAPFVGPLAKILVKRAALKARNREDLCRMVAKDIEDSAERSQFLTAVHS